MGQSLLILLPLLSGGLGALGGRNSPTGGQPSSFSDPVLEALGFMNTRTIRGQFCDRSLQKKYCDSWYGGDMHTACQFCGVGTQCPRGKVEARGIPSSFRNEILERHNQYRLDARTGRNGAPQTQRACLPPLQWDEELAETAQVWADQCAMIIYRPNIYPKVFHEKSLQRSTSRFHTPPGVGQNVAWALTDELNLTQIIDDLWYRDINKLNPGMMDNFQPTNMDSESILVTQMLWGHTTHIGCGWLQVEVQENKFADMVDGKYENFFVCNYGVGGNVVGKPVYDHPDCQQTESSTPISIPVFKSNEKFTTDGRTRIAACLDSILCLENSTSALKDCSKYTDFCFQPRSPPSDLDLTILECRVEELLCLEKPSVSDCRQRFRECIQSSDSNTEKGEDGKEETKNPEKQTIQTETVDLVTAKSNSGMSSTTVSSTNFEAVSTTIKTPTVEFTTMRPLTANDATLKPQTVNLEESRTTESNYITTDSQIPAIIKDDQETVSGENVTEQSDDVTTIQNEATETIQTVESTQTTGHKVVDILGITSDTSLIDTADKSSSNQDDAALDEKQHNDQETMRDGDLTGEVKGNVDVKIREDALKEDNIEEKVDIKIPDSLLNQKESNSEETLDDERIQGQHVVPKEEDDKISSSQVRPETAEEQNRINDNVDIKIPDSLLNQEDSHMEETLDDERVHVQLDVSKEDDDEISLPQVKPETAEEQNKIYDNVDIKIPDSLVNQVNGSSKQYLESETMHGQQDIFGEDDVNISKTHVVSDTSEEQNRIDPKVDIKISDTLEKEKDSTLKEISKNSETADINHNQQDRFDDGGIEIPSFEVKSETAEEKDSNVEYVNDSDSSKTDKPMISKDSTIFQSQTISTLPTESEENFLIHQTTPFPGDGDGNTVSNKVSQVENKTDQSEYFVTEANENNSVKNNTHFDTKQSSIEDVSKSMTSNEPEAITTRTRMKASSNSSEDSDFEEELDDTTEEYTNLFNFSETLPDIQDDILNYLNNTSGIVFANQSDFDLNGVLTDADGVANDTLLIFQDIFIDENGRTNITTTSNFDEGSTNPLVNIFDTGVIQAIKNSLADGGNTIFTEAQVNGTRVIIPLNSNESTILVDVLNENSISTDLRGDENRFEDSPEDSFESIFSAKDINPETFTISVASDKDLTSKINTEEDSENTSNVDGFKDSNEVNLIGEITKATESSFGEDKIILNTSTHEEPDSMKDFHNEKTQLNNMKNQNEFSIISEDSSNQIIESIAVIEESTPVATKESTTVATKESTTVATKESFVTVDEETYYDDIDDEAFNKFDENRTENPPIFMINNSSMINSFPYIQNKVLQSLGDIPGLVILNETDQDISALLDAEDGSNNDTLVILQDILIDDDGVLNISTTVNSEDLNTKLINAIDDDVKKAIQSAIGSVVLTTPTTNKVSDAIGLNGYPTSSKDFYYEYSTTDESQTTEGTIGTVTQHPILKQDMAGATRRLDTSTEFISTANNEPIDHSVKPNIDFPIKGESFSDSTEAVVGQIYFNEDEETRRPFVNNDTSLGNSEGDGLDIETLNDITETDTQSTANNQEKILTVKNRPGSVGDQQLPNIEKDASEVTSDDFEDDIGVGNTHVEDVDPNNYLKEEGSEFSPDSSLQEQGKSKLNPSFASQQDGNYQETTTINISSGLEDPDLQRKSSTFKSASEESATTFVPSFTSVNFVESTINSLEDKESTIFEIVGKGEIEASTIKPDSTTQSQILINSEITISDKVSENQDDTFSTDEFNAENMNTGKTFISEGEQFVEEKERLTTEFTTITDFAVTGGSVQLDSQEDVNPASMVDNVTDGKLDESDEQPKNIFEGQEDTISKPIVSDLNDNGKEELTSQTDILSSTRSFESQDIKTTIILFNLGDTNTETSTKLNILSKTTSVASQDSLDTTIRHIADIGSEETETETDETGFLNDKSPVSENDESVASTTEFYGIFESKYSEIPLDEEIVTTAKDGVLNDEDLNHSSEDTISLESTKSTSSEEISTILQAVDLISEVSTVSGNNEYFPSTSKSGTEFSQEQFTQGGEATVTQRITASTDNDEELGSNINSSLANEQEPVTNSENGETVIDIDPTLFDISIGAAVSVTSSKPSENLTSTQNTTDDFSADLVTISTEIEKKQNTFEESTRANGFTIPGSVIDNPILDNHINQSAFSNAKKPMQNSDDTTDSTVPSSQKREDQIKDVKVSSLDEIIPNIQSGTGTDKVEKGNEDPSEINALNGLETKKPTQETSTASSKSTDLPKTTRKFDPEKTESTSERPGETFAPNNSDDDLSEKQTSSSHGEENSLKDINEVNLAYTTTEYFESQSNSDATKNSNISPEISTESNEAFSPTTVNYLTIKPAGDSENDSKTNHSQEDGNSNESASLADESDSNEGYDANRNKGVVNQLDDNYDEDKPEENNENHQDNSPTLLKDVKDNKSSAGYVKEFKYVDESLLYMYSSNISIRLLLAICLEGIRCNPKNDLTRCGILHKRCNSHIDISEMGFSARVGISECTVEEILCSIGHRSPNVRCETPYGECVEAASGLDLDENYDDSVLKQLLENNKDFFKHKTQQDRTESGVKDPIDIDYYEDKTTDSSEKDYDEREELSTQIAFDKILPFLLGIGDLETNGGNEIEILEKVSNTTEYTVQDGNTVLNIDNQTLPVFQDFIVVLDDKVIDDLTEPGDKTLQNILNNMKFNISNVGIIYDPDSIQVGFDGEVSDEETEILNSIKSEINEAVKKVAESCDGKLCIQSISNENTTLDAFDLPDLISNPDNSTISPNEKANQTTPQVVIIEPKNKVQAQLSFCLSAIQCIDPVTCMFAQSKCLQLSNIDSLPPSIIMKLSECKVESLLCALQSQTFNGQNDCESSFLECGSELGVEISDGTIVNINVDEEIIDNKPKESVEHNSGITENIIISSNKDDTTVTAIASITSIPLEKPHFTTISSSLGRNDTSNTDTDSNEEDARDSQSFEYELNLPELVPILSKENISNDYEDILHDDKFHMDFPEFGFNIELEKNSSQCTRGSNVFNDFEFLPTADPCEICQCVVGEIKCFTKSCNDPVPDNCTPIRKEGKCCPSYDCADSSKVDFKEETTELPKILESDDEVIFNISTTTKGATLIPNLSLNEAANEITPVEVDPDLSKKDGISMGLDEALGLMNNIKDSIMDVFSSSLLNKTNIDNPEKISEFVGDEEFTEITSVPENVDESTFETPNEFVTLSYSDKVSNIKNKTFVNKQNEADSVLETSPYSSTNDQDDSKITLVTDSTPKSSEGSSSNDPRIEYDEKISLSTLQPTTVPFSFDDNETAGLETSSLLVKWNGIDEFLPFSGGKDVRVFLNFSWNDDDPNKKIKNNISSSLMNLIDNGDISVNISNNENFLTNLDQAIAILQTVKVNNNGDINFKTDILGIEFDSLSQDDLEEVERINKKTKLMLQNIFGDSKNDLSINHTAANDMISVVEEKADTAKDRIVDKETIGNGVNVGETDESYFINVSEQDKILNNLNDDENISENVQYNLSKDIAKPFIITKYQKDTNGEMFFTSDIQSDILPNASEDEIKSLVEKVLTKNIGVNVKITFNNIKNKSNTELVSGQELFWNNGVLLEKRIGNIDNQYNILYKELYDEMKSTVKDNNVIKTKLEPTDDVIYVGQISDKNGSLRFVLEFSKDSNHSEIKEIAENIIRNSIESNFKSKVEIIDSEEVKSSKVFPKQTLIFNKDNIFNQFSDQVEENEIDLYYDIYKRLKDGINKPLLLTDKVPQSLSSSEENEFSKNNPSQVNKKISDTGSVQEYTLIQIVKVNSPPQFNIAIEDRNITEDLREKIKSVIENNLIENFDVETTFVGVDMVNKFPPGTMTKQNITVNEKSIKNLLSSDINSKERAVFENIFQEIELLLNENKTNQTDQTIEGKKLLLSINLPFNVLDHEIDTLTENITFLTGNEAEIYINKTSEEIIQQVDISDDSILFDVIVDTRNRIGIDAPNIIKDISDTKDIIRDTLEHFILEVKNESGKESTGQSENGELLDISKESDTIKQTELPPLLTSKDVPDRSAPDTAFLQNEKEDEDKQVNEVVSEENSENLDLEKENEITEPEIKFGKNSTFDDTNLEKFSDESPLVAPTKSPDFDVGNLKKETESSNTNIMLHFESIDGEQDHQKPKIVNNEDDSVKVSGETVPQEDINDSSYILEGAETTEIHKEIEETQTEGIVVVTGATHLFSLESEYQKTESIEIVTDGQNIFDDIEDRVPTTPKSMLEETITTILFPNRQFDLDVEGNTASVNTTENYIKATTDKTDTQKEYEQNSSKDSLDNHINTEDFKENRFEAITVRNEDAMKESENDSIDNTELGKTALSSLDIESILENDAIENTVIPISNTKNNENLKLRIILYNNKNETAKFFGKQLNKTSKPVIVIGTTSSEEFEDVICIYYNTDLIPRDVVNSINSILSKRFEADIESFTNTDVPAYMIEIKQIISTNTDSLFYPTDNLSEDTTDTYTHIFQEIDDTLTKILNEEKNDDVMDPGKVIDEDLSSSPDITENLFVIKILANKGENENPKFQVVLGRDSDSDNIFQKSREMIKNELSQSLGVGNAAEIIIDDITQSNDSENVYEYEINQENKLILVTDSLDENIETAMSNLVTKLQIHLKNNEIKGVTLEQENRLQDNITDNSTNIDNTQDGEEVTYFEIAEREVEDGHRNYEIKLNPSIFHDELTKMGMDIISENLVSAHGPETEISLIDYTSDYSFGYKPQKSFSETSFIANLDKVNDSAEDLLYLNILNEISGLLEISDNLNDSSDSRDDSLDLKEESSTFSSSGSTIDISNRTEGNAYDNSSTDFSLIDADDKTDDKEDQDLDDRASTGIYTNENVEETFTLNPSKPVDIATTEYLDLVTMTDNFLEDQTASDTTESVPENVTETGNNMVIGIQKNNEDNAHENIDSIEIKEAESSTSSSSPSTILSILGNSFNNSLNDLQDNDRLDEKIMTTATGNQSTTSTQKISTTLTTKLPTIVSTTKVFTIEKSTKLPPPKISGATFPPTSLPTIVSTTKVFNLQKSTTLPPPKSSGVTESIIDTLVKLFIKTVDLTIKIKTAMDENSSRNTLEIISRKDNNSVKQNGSEVPSLIKITSEDAIEITDNGSQIEANEENQPVLILVESDDNLIINATNGNTVEIDFSDLPLDSDQREKIIRIKVRNLVQEIFVQPVHTQNSQLSLSDEIIKNITQIVLSKMEESSSVLPEIALPNLAVEIDSSTTAFEEDKVGDNTINDIETSSEGVTTNSETVKVTEPFNSLNDESTTTAETKELLKPIIVSTEFPTVLYTSEKTSSTEASSTISAETFEIESSKIINEVQNTISGIIKNVVASKQNETELQDLDDVVKLINAAIPKDIAIKTLEVDEKELKNKIKETVGELLTDKEIESVVRLRDKTRKYQDFGSITPSTITTTESSKFDNPFSIVLNQRPTEIVRKDDNEPLDTLVDTASKGTTLPTVKTTSFTETFINDVKSSDKMPQLESNVDDVYSYKKPDSENQKDNSEYEEFVEIPNISVGFNLDVIQTVSGLPATYESTPTSAFTTPLLTTKDDIVQKDANLATTEYFVENEEILEIDGPIDIEETIIEYIDIPVESFEENIEEDEVFTLPPADISENEIDSDIPEDSFVQDASLFIDSSQDEFDEVQNIIQDGSLFADTSNSGVVKATVVEDTSYARSIRPPSVGVAAIVSIVIGILALMCFSLMVFLAMARRRRVLEETPSHTAYTSTSRYTPEGTHSNYSDLKPAYIEEQELSPNLSTSSIPREDVVIPVDGHQTIIGLWEDFLDVPTAARPSILQSLPVSSNPVSDVRPTHEMRESDYSFTPRGYSALV